MTTTTGSLARKATAAQAAPEWVVFACDGHRFGVPLSSVREVLDPRPFTRLPGCTAAVSGLIGVRGRVVTTFDFGAVLSLRPSATQENHRVILVEHGERVFALVVDGIVAVARAAAAELPLGADALRALDIQRDDLIGIGAFGDEPFLAVDPGRVLARLLP